MHKNEVGAEAEAEAVAVTQFDVLVVLPWRQEGSKHQNTKIKKEGGSSRNVNTDYWWPLQPLQTVGGISFTHADSDSPAFLLFPLSTD